MRKNVGSKEDLISKNIPNGRYDSCDSPLSYFLSKKKNNKTRQKALKYQRKRTL